ncbi:MAG: RBBP9/YdeN family alpha/beta hydrolase [Rubrivivax sp.]
MQTLASFPLSSHVPIAATSAGGGCCAPRPRLLVVPGLHGSGSDHWQSWLQRRTPGSRRVEQSDWGTPDLEAWVARLRHTLQAEPPGPWIAAAHSFGCLALVQHLLSPEVDAERPVVAALLVAPASPWRFGLEAQLMRRVTRAELTVLASSNDPWLPTEAALGWAHAWGARLTDLGDAGHVNAASGHGPWPPVLQQLERLRQRWQAAKRGRPEYAQP